MPSALLRYITLTPTYSIIYYGHIILDLNIFIYAHFFRNTTKA
jgi:hypothetical protein